MARFFQLFPSSFPFRCAVLVRVTFQAGELNQVREPAGLFLADGAINHVFCILRRRTCRINVEWLFGMEQRFRASEQMTT